MRPDAALRAARERHVPEWRIVCDRPVADANALDRVCEVAHLWGRGSSGKRLSGEGSVERYGRRVGPMESYVDAWRRHDVEAIGSCVTESCRVVECYGPVYVGRDRIEQWATAWFAAGGVVHAWTIPDLFEAADRVAAQWVFDYTWHGSRSQLPGCSIATIEVGKVAVLHEYRAHSDTYEWTGAWRD